MKNRLYILRKLRKYSSMVRWPIIIMTIVSVVTAPVGLLTSKFFQILVDDVIEGRDFSKFIIVAVGLFLVYAIRFVSNGSGILFGNKILNTFTLNIRKDIFRKFKLAPYSFITKKDVGELKMRMYDDVESLGNFIKTQIVDYATNVTIVVFAMLVLIKTNREITFYCLIIVPVIFLLNYLISIGTKKTNEKIRKTNSECYTSTHNSLQFWKNIKLQNAEQTFISRFQMYKDQIAKLEMKGIIFWAFTEIFNDFKTNYMTKAFMYIVGSYFVLSFKMTIGQLIMFAEVFALLFRALDRLNFIRVSLQKDYPYYIRIFETLDFPEERENNKNKINFERNIKVKNLSFSYVENIEVIKDISFVINKGDYIAIVGKTGCGKSTIVKLLLGLFEKNSGEILFDDIDISNLDKNSINNIMGVVMQDNYLFNMSMRDNLLLANEFATDEEIYEACKKANIYEFVMSLPSGIETVIGEKGVKLSGGQLQRLSIAAAILQNPQILIFDEATSSLDTVSEKLINASIKNISDETTIVVVTHKHELVLPANKILVVDDGHIVAQGTYEQLIYKNEYFSKMVGANNEV